MGYVGSKYTPDALDGAVAELMGRRSILPMFTGSRGRVYWIKEVQRYYVATTADQGWWTNERERAVTLADHGGASAAEQITQLSLF